MLSFTPEVERALRVFENTHEIVTDFGSTRFRRISLPAPGRIEDQDARVMETMELLLDVQNDAIARMPSKKKDDDED